MSPLSSVGVLQEAVSVVAPMHTLGCALTVVLGLPTQKCSSLLRGLVVVETLYSGGLHTQCTLEEFELIGSSII